MKFKKIFLFALLFIVSLGFLACGEKDPEPDKVTKEDLEGVLAGVILDTSYKQLANDLVLASEVGGKYIITWTVDEKYAANAKIETAEDGTSKVKITRPEADGDWVQFVLTATINDGDVSASRSWTCYIKPKDKTAQMTCLEVLSAATGTKVTVKGVVTYVIDNKGYWVYDGTASVYVYQNGAVTVKSGDTVTVSGSKTIYYSLVEVESPSLDEVVSGTAEFDFAANAKDMTIADFSEIVANAKDEMSNYKPEVIAKYGEFYKITGRLAENTNSSISYKYVIVDDASGKLINLYDSNFQAGTADVLAGLLGKYVEAIYLFNDIHSNGYGRIVPVLSTIKETSAPTIADDVKVASTKAELEALFAGKAIATDVELPTSNQFDGLTIAWTSSNPAVLGNDGKLGTSTNPVEAVKLTAVITAGTVSETVELDVKAVFVSETTIADVNALCDGEAQFVMFVGKVVALDVDGYFYVADKTGAIYVRTKLEGAAEVGDVVKVVAKTAIYTSSGKQYTRQVTAEAIEKVDTKVSTGTPLKVSIADLAKLEDADGVLTDASVAAIKASAFYGKIVKVTGYIQVRGSYSNAYICESEAEDSAGVLIYYKSSDQDVIKSYAGKQVTITCTVYDCHGKDGWRLGSVIEIVEGAGEVEYNVISLAKALEISNPLTANTEEKYVVFGWVKAYYGKEESAKKYGNLVLTDGVNEFTIYGCYNATGELRYDAMGDAAPQVGDYIALYGVLGAYNGKGQMVNGWVISKTLEELAEISDPLTANTTEEYFVVCKVDAFYGKEESAKKYGNLTVKQNTEKTYTIYGTYDATGELRYDAMGDAAPQVGDVLLLKGVLGAYNGKGQMVNGKVVGRIPA